MDNILENKLWQIIDQEDLDTEKQLKPEDWQDFIDKYSVAFAECASDLARDLFIEYLDGKALNHEKN